MRLPLYDSFHFGKSAGRKPFFIFLFKTLFFILPAILISHLLDEFMNSLYNKTDYDSIHVIMLVIHMFLIITVMYVFIIYFENYSYEFQTTIAGSFFIALFFGFQPYFMDHLKYYIRKIC